MKNLLLFLILPLFLGVSSCNQNPDEECEHSDPVNGVAPVLASDNANVNSELSGVRTYSWDNGTTNASTEYFVRCYLDLYVDGNNLQNPITVTVYRIVNQTISDEIVDSTPSVAGVFTYSYFDETDLALAFDGCSGGITYRVSISFNTYGSQTLDDDYLDSLILSNTTYRCTYRGGPQ